MDDEELDILLYAGLDAICERYDINPVAVLKLMIEEGLVNDEDLKDD